MDVFCVTDEAKAGAAIDAHLGRLLNADDSPIGRGWAAQILGDPVMADGCWPVGRLPPYRWRLRFQRI